MQENNTEISTENDVKQNNFTCVPENALRFLLYRDIHNWNKWKDDWYIANSENKTLLISDIDLSYKKLTGADLSFMRFEGNCSFNNTQLDYCYCEKTHFFACNFDKTDFTSTNLDQAKFSSCNIIRTTFRLSNLRSVKIVNGIFTDNILTMSNMSGLSHIAKDDANIAFKWHSDAISNIAKASRNARGLFFILMGLCLFSILTTFTTTDLQLLLKNKPVELPIMGVKIPIKLFFGVIPFAIFAITLYFHRYIWDLFKLISKLPSTFPDGLSMSEKLFPWIFITRAEYLCKRYYKHLDWIDIDGLVAFTSSIAFILGWLFPLATICVTYWWFLPANEALINSLGISTIVITFFFIIFSNRYSIAKASCSSLVYKKSKLKKAYLALQIIAVLFAAFMLDSYVNSRYYDNSLNSLNIIDTDISTRKPDGTWQGAKLIGVNLSGADLSYSRLQNSQLNHAKFKDATLEYVNLQGAMLYHTVFHHASIYGSYFKDTNIEGADFSGADMRSTDFTGAVYSDCGGLGSMSGLYCKSTQFSGYFDLGDPKHKMIRKHSFPAVSPNVIQPMPSFEP